MRLPRFAVAAVLAATLLAQGPRADAQTPQKLRFQASFPPSSLIFENLKFWAERVKAMSGGRLEIEVAPAGTIVPAFEVLDAVHKKVHRRRPHRRRLLGRQAARRDAVRSGAGRAVRHGHDRLHGLAATTAAVLSSIASSIRTS